MGRPLVKVENVYKDYPLPKTSLFKAAPKFRALHGVSLEIDAGISFGVVGESGCGKSTLARIIMALDTPTKGKVYFNGQDLFNIPNKELRHLRRNFQMVFQDPYSSLNPRKNVHRIVAEPLETLEEKISPQKQKERVQKTLAEVGLNVNDIDKYPHEFSGGQRQRIAIARALITRPSLIVADESVSALDVSVQAQVLNLMMDLQDKYNLAYIFISHDLSVVEYITDKVAVIYLGLIVEQGNTSDVFAEPLHPYTKMLLNAVPNVDPLKRNKTNFKTVIEIKKDAVGCPFVNRCNQATGICSKSRPELTKKGKQLVSCHNA